VIVCISPNEPMEHVGHQHKLSLETFFFFDHNCYTLPVTHSLHFYDTNTKLYLSRMYTTFNVS